jgi:hypothetical protein
MYESDLGRTVDASIYTATGTVGSRLKIEFGRMVDARG